jgi:hypothetical protein
MASTATQARDSSKAKIYLPAKSVQDVENIRDITKDLLTAFSVLKNAPDVMYWLMATWGAESNWRLHFKRGNSFSSLHYTPSPPSVESTAGMGTIKSTGTLIGNGYQYSNVIQNLWNNPTTTLQTKENIKEGWYPHGITACMGTYHVRGCPNNKGEWRHYPEAVSLIGSVPGGLEVDPGQSIFLTLFAVDDEAARRRSIAAGMIIFNYKYRKALETTHKNNPSGALQMAVGNFLGKFGTRDNNGITPEDRVRQLNATSGTLVTMLQYVQIRRSGDATVLSPDLIDLSSRDAADKGSTQVVNNPTAYVAATNGGSNGTSAKTPGCAVV